MQNNRFIKLLYIMNDFTLGETEQIITCLDIEEIQQFISVMVRQTDRKIDILTHDFDPLIYNTDDMFDVFETFALQSHHSRVRVIMHNPQLIVSRGHCLIELGKRLSSFFDFRCISNRFASYPDTFLIADNIAVMHRPYPDSVKTSFHFCDAQLAKSLTNKFTDIWHESEPHPYLSNITI